MSFGRSSLHNVTRTINTSEGVVVGWSRLCTGDSRALGSRTRRSRALRTDASVCFDRLRIHTGLCCALHLLSGSQSVRGSGGMWRRRRLGLLAVLGCAALSATSAVDEASGTTPALVMPQTAQPSVGPRWPLTSSTQRKKDLGTLGAVLSVIMMAIIVLLGAGITAGYLYKRGRDLQWQHEQRVYEREMQRVTLPLSAFANPVCETVDENTLTPAQEPEEGQAGTPGA